MKKSRSVQRTWLLMLWLIPAPVSPISATAQTAGAPGSAPANQPQLVVQLGHAAGVGAAAFSPDGHLVVTGGADHTACLWDTDTGSELRRFYGHTDNINSAAFSPDGHFILTGSLDETARLWEVVTGKEVRRFTVNPDLDSISDVAFSPDGRYILTGGNDAILWDAATGDSVRRFQAARVRSVAFSPDGRFILTGSADKTVRLWATVTGQEVRRFAAHAKTQQRVTVPTAAFSPDGRFVLTGGEAATLWDAAAGQELRRFAEDSFYVDSVAFSPDGRFVLTGEEAGTPLAPLIVRVWNAATGQEVRRFEWSAILQRAPLAPSFSPNARFVLSGGGETAVLWDAATGQEHRRFTGYVSAVTAVTFSPDDRFVLVGSGNAALLWELATGREVKRFGRPAGTVNAVAFSPDGRSVLTGGHPPLWGERQSLGLWDVATGQEIQRFAQAGTTYSIAFSPDGRLILTGSGDTALLWETATGRVIQRLAGPGLTTMWAVAFSPDGRSVLTGSSGIGKTPSVCRWDVKTGRQIQCFTNSSFSSFGLEGVPHFQFNLRGGPPVLAFSPDGRFIVTSNRRHFLGSVPTSVDVWEIRSGQRMQILTSPSPVNAVTFSPKGDFVLTGGEDGAARLWERRGGQEVRSLIGHASKVNAVGFSSSGRFIVTGGADGTTRLWDADSGHELCRLISFNDGTWVAVDPAGRFDTNNLDNNPGLHWLMPDDPLTPLPLEIFMRDYYEPRLLPRILAGEKFRPVRSLQDLNRVQPKVHITRIEPQPNVPEAVAVTVAVAKATREFQRGNEKVKVETGVYDLRLFRDGQLVGYAPETDGELPVDPETGTAVRTFTVKLPLTAAQQVEFSAYAFNVDRVKSATDRKTFLLPKELPPVKGRAYLVTVGVNAYENPAWDLRFAANDARRIQRALQEQLTRTGQYADVISIPLISDAELRDGERVVTENQATKRNMHTVLKLLAGKPVDQEQLLAIPQAPQLHPARPEDLVLVAFSSHGYADPNGTFYFFPLDIGMGQGRQITESLLQHAISSDELSQWLRDVDAGELVLIVDACQSAATIASEGFKPGPMGSRGLGQLAYDKGMRVLTASQADDVALESDLLQQGLLTHALVHDGLEARQADFQPQDQTITLSEWLGYSVERVPTLYEEVKKGQVQAFGREQQGRGVVVVYSQHSSSLKQQGFQQPALFDFAKQRHSVVLVRGQ